LCRCSKTTGKATGQQAMITAVGATISGQQFLGCLVVVCGVLRSLDAVDGQHCWCHMISVQYTWVIYCPVQQLNTLVYSGLRFWYAATWMRSMCPVAVLFPDTWSRAPLL